MIKSKKTVWLGISAVVILLVVVIIFSSGELFMGQLGRKVARVAPNYPTINENYLKSPTIINSSTLTTVEKNPTIQNLVNTTFPNIEFKTSWLPKEYRKDTGKELMKIYPYPSSNNTQNTIKNPPLITDKVDTTNWTNFGIQGVGVITSVDFFPNDPNQLLMGTEGAGLFKSNNLGESWHKISSFPINRVNRVIIDPSDNQHYIVLANQNYLYESQNGGSSWDLVKKFNIGASSMVSTTDLILIDEKYIVRINYKTYISENNLQSFTEYDLPMQFGGDLKIFAGGKGLYGGRGLVGGGSGNTIYFTADYGKTWQLILDYNQTSNVGYIPNTYTIGNNSQKIVAYSSKYEGPCGRISLISTSNDFGQSWTHLEPTFINGLGENQCGPTPQDIFLDKYDDNHIIIFGYMSGIHESFDNGSTFDEGSYVQAGSSYNYDVLKLELTSKHMYSQGNTLIVPHDLRFGSMKAFTTLTGNIISPANFKYVQDAVLSPAKKTGLTRNQILLLPTDQGLFLYDINNKLIKNIAKNLYLADSGRVSVTSCPRIYSGLWHLGTYIIDEKGSIKSEIGEQYGFGLDDKNSCNSAALTNAGWYYPDGLIWDQDQTAWYWNDTFYRVNSYHLFQYYNGWWYAPVQNSSYTLSYILKIDFENQIREIITPPSNILYDYIEDFYIEKTSTGQIYWILQGPKLWKSNDLQNWTLQKDLSDTIIQNKISVTESETGNNIEGNLLTGGTYAFLHVNNDTILISGRGLYISNNAGKNWHTHFPFAQGSNVIIDKNGTIYIGLRPADAMIYFGSDNSEATGVWYSEDNGITWNLYGKGLEKSWITGLAYDEQNNVLYASTMGESLFRIKLEYKPKIIPRTDLKLETTETNPDIIPRIDLNPPPSEDNTTDSNQITDQILDTATTETYTAPLVESEEETTTYTEEIVIPSETVQPVITSPTLEIPTIELPTYQPAR